MSNVTRRTILKNVALGAPLAATSLLLVPTQATASTKWASTGGYSYETDTFYVARAWNSEYRQYTFTVTWGGIRDVWGNGAYWNHRLESVQIKHSGRHDVITRFATVKQTPETYWLNTQYAMFKCTTKIKNLKTGAWHYRATPWIIF